LTEGRSARDNRACLASGEGCENGAIARTPNARKEYRAMQHSWQLAGLWKSVRRNWRVAPRDGARLDVYGPL